MTQLILVVCDRGPWTALAPLPQHGVDDRRGHSRHVAEQEHDRIALAGGVESREERRRATGPLVRVLDKDGTAGDNYTTTFTVAAAPATARVVSLPDFVRGPNQAVNLTTGIPIRLSDGTGVTAVSLQIRYDPALLRSLTSDLQGRLSALERFSLVSDTWAAVLAGRGSYHAFGAAVSASACPEIVISIAIDAPKAKFLVIVLFPCCSEFPIAGNAHRHLVCPTRGIDVGFAIGRRH